MDIKTISVDISGERIDSYLAKELEFTRSRVQKLIDDEKVTINDLPVKAKHKVLEGEIIVVYIEEDKQLDLEPVNIPLDIVYEDNDFAIINKQQGLTVHAGNGVKGYTLVNALLYHLDNLSGINGVIRPGIVHRIDKDTSGLLVVAKNDKAHLSLAKQIADKTCFRIYWALCEGVFKDDSGRVETFIDRSDKNRTMMAVSNTGRKAITNYKVIERFDNYTLCEFKLETGRTHQIRVHAKYLGHPIVGDKVYGYKNQKFNLEGQLLHAKRLELTHPSTGERVCFEADIPDYFKEIIDKLRKM